MTLFPESLFHRLCRMAVRPGSLRMQPFTGCAFPRSRLRAQRRPDGFPPSNQGELPA